MDSTTLVAQSKGPQEQPAKRMQSLYAGRKEKRWPGRKNGCDASMTILIALS